MFSFPLSRKTRMRALALLFGVLCGMVILEGTARVTYKAPWQERLVAEQAASLGKRYATNSLGFRDKSYSMAKPLRTHRILVLGDSFTFGLGVLERDDVFTEILEKRLNALDFGHGLENVEVLNAGIPASMTEDWLVAMTNVWDSFGPDTVVAVYFLRDGIPGYSIPDFFGKIRREITKANRGSLLYRYSYAVRLFKDRVDRDRISKHYTRHFVDSYLGDQKLTARWKQTQSTLLSIRDEAQQRCATFALVIFPILVQLDTDYPFASICEHIEAFSRHHGIATHNLLPAFQGSRGPELWVSPHDQHPNEKAHLIAAESLVPFVADIVRRNRRSVRGTETECQQ